MSDAGDAPQAKKYLHSFYAVTLTSVYQVRIGTDDPAEEVPVLIKIAKKGDGKIDVGTVVSNGTMVAICQHLQMFIPEGSGQLSPSSTIEREVVRVNTHYWGGHTTQIVALFFKEADALECSCESDLQPCDPRWKKDTIAILRAIGDDHPYCSISAAMPGWWLVPPSEWRDSADGKT